MSHKTLIGGAAREVTGGNALIGGTAREISGGKTLIGGTGREISFGPEPLVLYDHGVGLTPDDCYICYAVIFCPDYIQVGNYGTSTTTTPPIIEFWVDGEREAYQKICAEITVIDPLTGKTGPYFGGTLYATEMGVSGYYNSGSPTSVTVKGTTKTAVLEHSIRRTFAGYDSGGYNPAIKTARIRLYSDKNTTTGIFLITKIWLE